MTRAICTIQYTVIDASWDHISRCRLRTKDYSVKIIGYCNHSVNSVLVWPKAITLSRFNSIKDITRLRCFCHCLFLKSKMKNFLWSNFWRTNLATLMSGWWHLEPWLKNNFQIQWHNFLVPSQKSVPNSIWQSKILLLTSSFYPLLGAIQIIHDTNLPLF